MYQIIIRLQTNTKLSHFYKKQNRKNYLYVVFSIRLY